MEKSIDFQLIPFDFWADMFEKTHGYVRIFLGVSIPFFSFLVNDVQSRKKRVFLQSWCVFNLLSVFEETLWRKQMSFLYLSCSEYSFLYFFGHWRSKQKKCFSTILVCPYLTFILWRNIIDKTNNISVFFLVWAYLSLVFSNGGGLAWGVGGGEWGLEEWLKSLWPRVSFEVRVTSSLF